MKKMLFIVLDVLLVVIICLCILKGFNIGSFRILSFQDIKNSNEELTNIIANANGKNDEYNSQLAKIKTDTEALTKAKKDYLDLMTVSTDSEIQEALQTKTYSIEYLWSQVGNHATKEGVVTKMEVSSSSVGDPERRNLNFTATGSYLSITNFISDIENDSDLDFTIDNFDMTTGKATFVVKDIKIKKENTSVSNNNAPSMNNNKTENKNSNQTTNEVNSNATQNNNSSNSNQTN